jgi:hypothetical protein
MIRVFLALVFAWGCSSCGGCPANKVATESNGCAVACTFDGGTDGGACPTGTTCKSANAPCGGTACRAAHVEVCVP